jgi:S-adenosylmethionine hydrolase
LVLLTDFGLQDGYGGIMKGIIIRIAPQATVIDLSHGIPPQNVLAGRFCLLNAYRYFPPETVFIGVVDPGVGSQRRGIAVKFAEGYFVGPDNGLISGILSESPPILAVSLTNSDYWRVPQPSGTFHGRDIFASVGAHLALGVALELLGEPLALKEIVNLSLPPLQVTDLTLTGCIQYIDHFGNLITNIPAALLREKRWAVGLSGYTIPQGQTYSAVPAGKAIALIGSHDWLEIAVNGGNAQDRFGINWGDCCILSFLS